MNRLTESVGDAVGSEDLKTGGGELSLDLLPKLLSGDLHRWCDTGGDLLFNECFVRRYWKSPQVLEIPQETSLRTDLRQRENKDKSHCGCGEQEAMQSAG